MSTCRRLANKFLGTWKGGGGGGGVHPIRQRACHGMEHKRQTAIYFPFAPVATPGRPAGVFQGHATHAWGARLEAKRMAWGWCMHANARHSLLVLVLVLPLPLPPRGRSSRGTAGHLTVTQWRRAMPPRAGSKEGREALATSLAGSIVMLWLRRARSWARQGKAKQRASSSSLGWGGCRHGGKLSNAGAASKEAPLCHTAGIVQADVQAGAVDGGWRLAARGPFWRTWSHVGGGCGAPPFA